MIPLPYWVAGRDSRGLAGQMVGADPALGDVEAVFVRPASVVELSFWDLVRRGVCAAVGCRADGRRRDGSMSLSPTSRKYVRLAGDVCRPGENEHIGLGELPRVLDSAGAD